MSNFRNFKRRYMRSRLHVMRGRLAEGNIRVPTTLRWFWKTRWFCHQLLIRCPWSPTCSVPCGLEEMCSCCADVGEGVFVFHGIGFAGQPLQGLFAPGTVFCESTWANPVRSLNGRNRVKLSSSLWVLLGLHTMWPRGGLVAAWSLWRLLGRSRATPSTQYETGNGPLMRSSEGGLRPASRDPTPEQHRSSTMRGWMGGIHLAGVSQRASEQQPPCRGGWASPRAFQGHTSATTKRGGRALHAT